LGVSTVPCGVVSRPKRARESVAVFPNVKEKLSYATVVTSTSMSAGRVGGGRADVVALLLLLLVLVVVVEVLAGVSCDESRADMIRRQEDRWTYPREVVSNRSMMTNRPRPITADKS
jgi:hypothetical protein